MLKVLSLLPLPETRRGPNTMRTKHVSRNNAIFYRDRNTARLLQRLHTICSFMHSCQRLTSVTRQHVYFKRERAHSLCRNEGQTVLLNWRSPSISQFFCSSNALVCIYRFRHIRKHCCSSFRFFISNEMKFMNCADLIRWKIRSTLDGDKTDNLWIESLWWPKPVVCLIHYVNTKKH